MECGEPCGMISNYVTGEVEKAHGMIVFPRLHLEHGTPKCLEIFERFRHGTVRSRYAFLPRDARGAPGPYKPIHTRLDCIRPRIMRWRPNATSHVRAHTNPRATQRKERAFTPRGPTGTVPLLVRVLRYAKHVVGSLKREHGHRDIGLDEWDRACAPQEPDKRAIVGHRFARHCRVPNARVVALDGEHVLEGDGDAGERAGAGCATGPLLCGRDHDLGEAVGFGVGLQCALGVCCEDIGGVERCGLDAGYDGGDGAGEDVLVVGGQGLAIHGWKGSDSRCTFALFVIADGLG